jgi:hypothetical protein
VIIAPKSLRSKIITVTYGDIMTGHKSKNKIKERIISYYGWLGMDREIEIHIKSV